MTPTPKEKARELVDKYWSLKWQTHKSTKNYKIISMAYSAAKQSALIAVDEIVNCDSFFKTLEETKEFTEYWCNVQKEIQSL